uniref:Uncharacterized protein n=1 Tax=Latilactobacillus sakei TaxID=1599 RepID=A0A2H1MYG7_LATSK|nr:Plasmid hypothetical protein [Latilactobacillus sakei]
MSLFSLLTFNYFISSSLLPSITLLVLYSLIYILLYFFFSLSHISPSIILVIITDCQKYGEIKRAAAKKFPTDIEGYLDMKGVVISEIYQRCGLLK